MQFHVKALRDSESIVSLAVEAADEADAARQARASGLHVLSLRRAAFWNFALAPGRSRFPVAVFAQELLALLAAGLTLVEAIEGLAEKEEHRPTLAVFEHLKTQLQQGRTLSQAMQDLPEAFPTLFVASVRATERTGDVPEALRRYVSYQAQVNAVRGKLISASLYPVLLMGVGVLVLLFLLGYVVPRFSHVYEEIEGELPLMSRLLLEAGKFLDENGVIAGGVFLVVVVVLVRLALLPQSRNWLAAQLQKIPAIGSRMHLYQLGRFYRTLGMLLRGGTPVVAALDMCSGLLATGLRENLGRAAQMVREGRTLSDAMAANGLTTPLALRMLRVGEKSGRMVEMMEHIAAFCDEEISRWVDWFSRLFEPLLMALIGVVIGVIVVLMYLPVFELAGRIQ